jgi:5,5'-dehydrodivanillate O-demethylase
VKTFDALNFDVPTITAEETEYGLRHLGKRGADQIRAQHIMMPNIYSAMLPSPDPRIKEWPISIAWRVPIDDLTHKTLQVYFHAGQPVDPADFAAARRERMAVVEKLRPSNEVASDILANRLDLFDPEIMDRPDYVNIQDHVAQMGQGAIANREAERLGIGDTGIILLRKIWLRELSALAQGRALTPWRYPDRLDRRKGS